MRASPDVQVRDMGFRVVKNLPEPHRLMVYARDLKRIYKEDYVSKQVSCALVPCTAKPAHASDVS